jgi:hypothetical protein
MKFMFFSLGHRALIAIFCLVLASSQAVFAADDWREVTPAELQMKTPTVEPDADAEAIFWEVRVDDSSAEELALKHYVRVKIFTEKGREDFSRHDIVFVKGMRVRDVEARVTKPDGTVVFLKKEDVLEREIVRANGVKVKAKSFALPGLEIGSIVEYRYREIISDGSANMRLIFQHEIPVQTISYFVKPFSGDGTRDMRYLRFNVGDTGFVKDKNGFSRATMTNVPAFREEPSMLPEDQVRSWMYIYYTDAGKQTAEEYWKERSKAIFESTKGPMKVTDEVKAATAQAIGDAASDEEKLRKIYDYVQTQIRNLTYSTNVSDEDWKKVRSAKTATDTLKLKMGSAGDLDIVFGAMARAAGFDARLALSGSRDEMFFDPNVANLSLMLNSSSIAVKVGTDWRFFSPAGFDTQYGMMSWAEENETAMIPDPKELIWRQIPLSPPEKSMKKTTGKFKLLDDGSLEGEGRIEFTGHLASRHRSINRGDSATEQEKTMREMIRSNLPSAEVTSFTIENPNEPAKPFAYNFKVRVPGYATRTGKRIFLQPNVFMRDAKPRFTSNTRKYDVYISYPWLEQDEITIELPAGYSLENPDAPPILRDGQGIGSHETSLSVSADKRSLIYKRKFFFGNGGFIRFPVTAYPAVKQFFEAFNKADTHQLTLRQDAATATVSTN